MTFGKVSATVQATQDAFTEDVESENKPATADQAVARFEAIKPLTKSYWAAVALFSFASIPGIAIPIYYRFTDVPDSVIPVSVFSLMWGVFGCTELARFAFKQNHTARAMCVGGMMNLFTFISLLVFILIIGDDDE